MYEMVENASYIITKHGHPMATTTDVDYRKSSDKSTSASGTTGLSNCSKVAVVLACCSILLAICSLAIAAYAVANAIALETRVDNMNATLSALGIAGSQMPPLQQLYQDVNTTQSQVRILTDDVSGLTAVQSTISEMVMEINNVSRGLPGEN